MTPWGSWWDRLSHQARFRFYTRVTLQLTLAVLAGAVVISGWDQSDRPLLIMGTALGTLSAVLVLEAQPDLATHQPAAWSARGLRAGAGAQVSVWACAVLVSELHGSETVSKAGTAVATLTTLLLVLSVLATRPAPWLSMFALAVLTGLLIGDDWPVRLNFAAALTVAGVLILATMRATLWAVNQMAELERAKDTAAKLKLAEERLRFSRDLHDVVGRGFSAIAVKSELASTLARAGAPERAADEIDEVKALAVSSMEEMRALVRGYRKPDLATELAGARSLLSATGCRLDIHGDPAAIDPALHDIAAWVVREGTTNIVKHSSATTAELAVGASRMTLSNDGATQPAGPLSGLGGLRERLAPYGASLTIAHDSDTAIFTLEIRWERT